MVSQTLIFTTAVVDCCTKDVKKHVLNLRKFVDHLLKGVTRCGVGVCVCVCVCVYVCVK